MHFYPLCIVERKRPAINLVSARTFLELFWTAKPFVLWAFHIRIKIKGLPHNMLPTPLFGQVACTNKSPNCCQSGAQSKLHLICFLSLLDASLLHGEQSWLQKSSMCVRATPKCSSRQYSVYLFMRYFLFKCHFRFVKRRGALAPSKRRYYSL